MEFNVAVVDTDSRTAVNELTVPKRQASESGRRVQACAGVTTPQIFVSAGAPGEVSCTVVVGW